MQYLIDAGILLAAYLFGSIPFGLIVVKLMTGKDIRTIASGRTGGTNAMRAAGPWAGVLTAIFDILKAAATVWIAQVISSNVCLMERGPDGRVRLRGGAGGAATGGGAFGLWPPAAFILIPFGLLVWFGTGYASVTTLSIGLAAILIFGVRAALGLGPWQYILYGVVAEILLIWALRPNIQRLKEGSERRHGLPAFLAQRKEAKDRKDKA